MFVEQLRGFVSLTSCYITLMRSELMLIYGTCANNGLSDTGLLW